MLRCTAFVLGATLLYLAGWQVHGQDPNDATTNHFHFREPHPAGYLVDQAAARPKVANASAPAHWIEARPDNGSNSRVLLGDRVVLQLKQASDLTTLVIGRPLRVARSLGNATYILQAPDVWTALREAQSLARDERVIAAHPVTARAKERRDVYAARPNDPFFYRPDQPQEQWQANLENRDTNGLPLGIDLNVRAAWPLSRGTGVLLAIADDGVQLDHPDLIKRTTGAPHFNFVTGEADGIPSGDLNYHGTAVAGLAAATSNNQIGIAGVAPEAQIASLVVFGPNDDIISEEVLMDMFQYQSNVVMVQNHSWGKVDTYQFRLSSLEDIAISNAVHLGRAGRGVVLVRAGGNGRTPNHGYEGGNDANDDGYVADPRVIGVAAVRLDGRWARYSSPGACLLVGAPSGDVSAVLDPCLSDSPNLVTTDRQGAGGYNSDTSSVGGGDYAYGATGFNGTSASTPQISGVAALILGANTNLTYRDVQQILIQSARPYDLNDSSLATNGAGFLVSHNVGFGIPDAGRAVQLARAWSNRPPAITVTYSLTNRADVPDLGLRVRVDGTDVPDSLRSLAAVPGPGRHPNADTALLPLVDAGNATSVITADLRGKAALIQRGPNYFCEKVTFAAQAGAEFAIIYNNRDGNARIQMEETDVAPIPAVFLNQIDGEALRDFVAAQPDARAGLTVQSTNYTFNVQDTLLCEFIGVRINADHSARGDLRIVLTSPAGTRSVLQHVNEDTLPGPSDWTYYSVQHFYESSYGTWTLSVVDEDDKGTGAVTSASLIINGVPMTDTDHDGLDDNWELQHFHSLAFGPLDDPDGDGLSNAREQILGTDPNAIDTPFRVDISLWDQRLARLSWPATTNTIYQVQFGHETAAPLSLTTNIPGRFPQTEWFVPYTNLLQQFFQLQATPGPR